MIIRASDWKDIVSALITRNRSTGNGKARTLYGSFGGSKGLIERTN